MVCDRVSRLFGEDRADMSMRGVARGVVAVGVVASVLVPVGGGRVASAARLPDGFREQVVFSGLTKPTNLEFAPDGRIFVAEKAGTIKVYDSLTDTTPTVFADLSNEVFDGGDRGLLGLALSPNFPTDPYVYVLYTKDGLIDGTAPKYKDDCTSVGGLTSGKCVVSGQLSRLRADGDMMTGSEQKLLNAWCQPFASHSQGELRFGSDGALYVSSGDGASYSAVDYGQLPTTAPNPCGDPTKEGGALRSQDLRTSADPAGLSGALLRLDPATGEAKAGNPLIGSTDANAKRIVAEGLRNPYRFALRPGTSEVWLYDTGWNEYEEIDRLVNPTADLTNFGWPCYEGPVQNAGYRDANLPICQSLYSANAATGPLLTYKHSDNLVAGDNACPTGGSATGGIAFTPQQTSYPNTYQGAVFFADYSRRCIWTMSPGSNGVPSADKVTRFAAGLGSPVDLEFGPGGELYYVDLGGTVRRFRYYTGNQPPLAQFAATPTAGKAPLRVSFDASATTDPDLKAGEQLTYAWDFGDGATGTGKTVTHEYAKGTYTARLTAGDSSGATDTATVTIHAGEDLPVATIGTPTASTTWATGQTISFSGSATDDDGTALPASKLSWEVVLLHCYPDGGCHEHSLQTINGVASGSFLAPDHEYPSYVDLRLTATGSHGTSTSSVRLSPKTVQLTFTSSPVGVPLTVGSQTDVTPFTRTVIAGSTMTVSAPTRQVVGSRTYYLSRWSDGGSQTHVVTAPSSAGTVTANYMPCSAEVRTCAVPVPGRPR
jgi:glucose/arabinose dehydrogenase